MRISRVRVKNFRSIREADFAPNHFNIIVGKNNHGKSNLLEAIEWFYTGKGDIAEIGFSGKAEEEFVEVEIEFDAVQEGLRDIDNEDNRRKLSNIIGVNDTMRVRRTSREPKTRQLFNPATVDWQKTPTGADPSFNNCMPRFEFILTDKSLKEVSAFKSTTPIGQMLSGVLSDALQSDPQYLEFKAKFEALFGSEDSSVRQLLKATSEKVQSHLAQQFPDCRAIDFRVEIPPFEDFLKSYSTHIDDGIQTTAEAKGDGMQRALMLAIIKAHADMRRDEALGRAFIFFIDEAELHLHPTAQRQLKAALMGLSAGSDQVFMTTHSSVFLAEESRQQQAFSVEKSSGVTVISPMRPHDRVNVVYQLLGGSPADLLFPANFLIVEGPSEVEFLKAVCARHYSDQPLIQITAAGGDDARQANYRTRIVEIYQPLQISPIYRERAVVLFDKPTGEEKERRLRNFLLENKHLEYFNLVHVLPELGLEEYYPTALRERHADVTNKVRLAGRIGACISREEFESEMPVMFQALQRAWEFAYK